MATEKNLMCISLKAAADLSALQYRFMKISAADTVNQQTTAGAKCVGVLLNEPAAAGRAADIAYAGKCKVEAGAVVAAGAQVMSDTVGRAITSTTGKNIQGTALQAASAAGEIIEVLLENEGHTA